MRGKKRPMDERATAVGLALVVGQEEAGRKLGIPKTTIHAWMNRPEFAQLRTTAREVVAEQMWVIIQEGLEQIAAGLKGDERLKDKADAVDMLITKRALLMGDPTERTETRDLTGVLNDHELDLLRAAVQRETATEPAAEVAVESSSQG